MSSMNVNRYRKEFVIVMNFIGLNDGPYCTFSNNFNYIDGIDFQMKLHPQFRFQIIHAAAGNVELRTALQGDPVSQSTEKASTSLRM